VIDLYKGCDQDPLRQGRHPPLPAGSKVIAQTVHAALGAKKKYLGRRIDIENRIQGDPVAKEPGTPPLLRNGWSWEGSGMVWEDYFLSRAVTAAPACRSRFCIPHSECAYVPHATRHSVISLATALMTYFRCRLLEQETMPS